MAMQFRRYADNQIFAFDFGGSIRAAAIACGGDWQDLGGALHDQEGGESLALQPLTRIDDPGERAWAAEWLAAILGSEGVTVNPAAKEHLWTALGSLRSEEHTSELQSLMRISYAVFCLKKKKQQLNLHRQ